MVGVGWLWCPGYGVGVFGVGMVGVGMSWFVDVERMGGAVDVGKSRSDDRNQNVDTSFSVRLAQGCSALGGSLT